MQLKANELATEITMAIHFTDKITYVCYNIYMICGVYHIVSLHLNLQKVQKFFSFANNSG